MKFRISDRRQMLRHLRRLKAKSTAARVYEINTLYDVPDGKLARNGRMLRLRLERPAGRAYGARKSRELTRGQLTDAQFTRERPEIWALLTFKGPARGEKTSKPGRYKVREEHEVRVSDYEAMPRILEALGMHPWFRYEKFRSTFELPGMGGLKLTLDETPIGLFLELEGEREAIDRAARLLGFDRSDYISKSYGALFMEERGLSPPASHNEPVPSCGLPDMLFRS